MINADGQIPQEWPTVVMSYVGVHNEMTFIWNVCVVGKAQSWLLHSTYPVEEIPQESIHISVKGQAQGCSSSDVSGCVPAHVSSSRACRFRELLTGAARRRWESACWLCLFGFLLFTTTKTSTGYKFPFSYKSLKLRQKYATNTNKCTLSTQDNSWHS